MSHGGVIERHVAMAIERHRPMADVSRLVAEELPPSERTPWLRMADALERGDVAAGTKAAAASLACWIPLFASAAGDPRVPIRMLQTAARPPVLPKPWLWLFAYPLVVVLLALALVAFLAATVLPTFEAMYVDFGMQLPAATRAVLALRPFMSSVWQPIVAAAGFVSLPWWLGLRRAARSATVTASFTRTLARLVAADIATDEAIALASHAAGVGPQDPAAPRRPLTHAAVAALDTAPASAAVLLDAIADCHDDLARGRRGFGEWFIGPVLIGFVGLFVGFVTVALFMPLIKLVGALS